jgi:hypothetical protein
VAAVVTALTCGTVLSAQRPADNAARATRVPIRAVAPKVLPGTTDRAFATIQGNALDATNGALPNSMVRLRDVRYGRVEDTQITDSSGLFTFRNVEPGSYIVELIEAQQRVLATSDLVSVNAADSASTIVKLPLRIQLMGGRLGSATSQVLAVLSAAATSGVLAVRPTGEDVSPR